MWRTRTQQNEPNYGNKLNYPELLRQIRTIPRSDGAQKSRNSPENKIPRRIDARNQPRKNDEQPRKCRGREPNFRVEERWIQRKKIIINNPQHRKEPISFTIIDQTQKSIIRMKKSKKPRHANENHKNFVNLHKPRKLRNFKHLRNWRSLILNFGWNLIEKIMDHEECVENFRKFSYEMNKPRKP